MNKKGFIATSVLYTLVALLAMILLVIINNYASVVKINRVESEYIKEEIYDGDSDIIFVWKYDGTKGKPTIFPEKGKGYHISNIECIGGVGSFNSYTWKAEVRMTANKARCNLTVSDGDITTASLNATSADLLTTKSCLVVNNNGDLVLVNGSMTNNGAITKNLTTSGESYTIPKGYHNGSGKVTGPTLASLVGTNVTLASAANLLTGYTAYGKNGVKITGSMPNHNAVTQTLNAGGSYTIPKGYHNGSGKITASSLASQTSATATAVQILTGQTAWVNGSKITGTMPNKGVLNWKPTTSTTYTVPAGYYSGGTLDSSGAYNAGYAAAKNLVTKTFTNVSISTSAELIFNGQYWGLPAVMVNTGFIPVAAFVYNIDEEQLTARYGDIVVISNGVGTFMGTARDNEYCWTSNHICLPSYQDTTSTVYVIGYE